MRRLPLTLTALLLAACTTRPLPPASAPPAPAVPASSVPRPADAAAWYEAAARRGQAVYRIDSARSLITVTVRRGGALARLGHDHVVASRTVTGFAAPAAGRADFQFRLDQMTVDEPALRAAAGLDTQPSADAINGTRVNMLERVLEAQRYPLVELQVRRLTGDPQRMQLAVTLHGVTRTELVPVRVDQTGNTITASGELSLLQSDFGITPMSIMGGALTVQDRMALQFTIVAVR